MKCCMILLMVLQEMQILMELQCEVIEGLGRFHFNRSSDKCSIPDDHIDPRRSAFFMARSVLRDIRSEVRAC